MSIRKWRVKTACCLLAVLFSAEGEAQNLNQKLSSAWAGFAARPQLRHAAVSLSVIDVNTGQVIFSKNGDEGLAPASTLKTLTSITALYQLGADYRFKTRLATNGTVDASGTLNGDLIICGGNDPSLGSWRWEETKEGNVLNAFVTAIRQAGIRKISGAVIGEGENHFPPGWIWQDLGNYYGAAPNELCWRENQYDIHLRTGRPGSAVQFLKTVPLMPYLTYRSELRSGRAGSGDNAYARLPVNNSLVLLQGTYAIDESKKRISAAIPDPAYDAALRLSDTLKKIGIAISGQPRTQKAGVKTARTLAVHQSPELGSLIYWLNKKSINLYAEQMLRSTGDSARTENPIAFLKTFWQQKGIDSLTLNIQDGSGLSPGNRIATLSLARVLQQAKSESWYPVFFESLPLYNNMHMKSGSISDVLAYAGYHTAPGGREVCFSLIVNNYSGSSSGMRSAMFTLLNALK